MCCVGAQLDELITCSKDQICLVFSTPLLSARQDFQDLKINILGPIYMPWAHQNHAGLEPGWPD